MGSISIPQGGLALMVPPNSDKLSMSPDGKPTQVMRLNLAQDILDELLKGVRSGGQDLQITFGKTPVWKFTILIDSL